MDVAPKAATPDVGLFPVSPSCKGPTTLTLGLGQAIASKCEINRHLKSACSRKLALSWYWQPFYHHENGHGLAFWKMVSPRGERGSSCQRCPKPHITGQ